jgi:hypothetical protein
VEEDDTANFPVTTRAAIASSSQRTNSDLCKSCHTSVIGMETPNSSQRVRGKKKIDVADDPNLALVKFRV